MVRKTSILALVTLLSTSCATDTPLKIDPPLQTMEVQSRRQRLSQGAQELDKHMEVYFKEEITRLEAIENRTPEQEYSYKMSIMFYSDLYASDKEKAELKQQYPKAFEGKRIR